MTIIAIDPSLTNTAVVMGSGPENFRIATFGSKNVGDDVHGRISRYSDLVHRVMEFVLNGDGIEAVYMEAYSFGSNDARAKFSAEYGGLLREQLVLYAPRIYEVAPMTLKKFATGKGAGKKEMVIAHLMKRYEVEFSTNDEFDAYGLYRLGLVAEGICAWATEAQRECSETVLGLGKAKRKKKTA